MWTAVLLSHLARLGVAPERGNDKTAATVAMSSRASSNESEGGDERGKWMGKRAGEWVEACLSLPTASVRARVEQTPEEASSATARPTRRGREKKEGGNGPRWTGLQALCT